MQYYKDPTELTDEQKKAVTQLRRAFSAAKRANIYFYNVLGDIMALNGSVVDVVYSEDDRRRSDCSLREFSIAESVAKINCEFADDEHYVKFKTKAGE
jgi:hypothetical protein